jgi:thiol-disulfide isomerase/thioredoxin
MLLISPLRGYVSLMASSLVGFIAYFVLTNYFINKYKSQLQEIKIVITILAGLCFLQLPSHTLDYQATLGSLPDFLIHILGILIGFIYYRSGKMLGVAITLVALGFVLYVYFDGYERWLNYKDYGTFAYNVSETVPEFNMINPKGPDFTNKDLKDKIVVFDFWNTGCGVCFRKFPLLQEKVIKYKSNPGIEFYAVNIPIRRDTIGEAEKIISDYAYTFPLLVARNDSLAKLFKVFAYPAVVIIKNGKEIIFRGNIEGVDEILEKLETTVK